ncbi:MAG: phosphatase PAP2 family protein [Patescibacteria group bacterium]|nr:phosphatase PAP2 family protein [Patescibacteria group bacterium]MCL5262111.1 phosphatase PAP2 family protein [Patescibacteria group bacterium]
MFAFDKPVFDWLYGLANHFWFFDFLVVFSANWLIYIALAAFLVAVLRVKNLKTEVYYLCLASLGAILSRGIIAETIRYANYNPRPFEELGIKPLINQYATASFPSGHVSFIFPIALAAFSYNKKLGAWLIAATVVMGISRVIAGVHWISDIAAGLLVGAIGFLIARAVLPKLAGRK